MDDRERTEAGTFAEKVTLDAVRDVFDAVRGPVVTSSDVADALDCTTEAARQKLTRLYDRGEVDKRKTGRTVVYWRTDTDDESGREPAVTPSGDRADRSDVPSDASDTRPDAGDDTGEDVILPEEIDAEVWDAVEDATDEWERDARLDARKQAAATVLQYALDTGEAVGKSHAVVDAIRGEFPVEGQNRETYWRKNLRDGILKRYGDYSKSTHGYTVADIGSDS